ncbi:hypothetical protein BH10PSE14_BH10PSE14_27290 [soil metagenome]
MNGFDLVFAMFGLVLGLAVTEVLAGFARIIKMRRKAHVGWLTPLLGTFVLIDMTTFWNTIYAYRDYLHADLATLLVVLAFVGSYYLISTLVFPDDPEQWPDFDVYYDLHNRQVLGGMLALTVALFAVAVITSAMGLPGKADTVAGDYGWITAVAGLLHIPLLVLLLIVKSRRLNIALLGVEIALMLIAAFAKVL